MRARIVIIDISLVLILLAICLDFNPEKNEVDADFTIKDINRLGIKDLATSQEELVLLFNYQTGYDINATRQRIFIAAIDAL